MRRTIAAIFIWACGSSAGTIDSLTASPATITFNATEPENGSVAGSSVATIIFTTNNAAGKAWTLSVQSTTTEFTGCSGVQVGDVTVACSSIVDSTGGSYSCSAPQALSTSYAQVAAGIQSSGPATTITITLAFTFADNWHHPAKAAGCPLTIRYQAYTAP